MTGISIAAVWKFLSGGSGGGGWGSISLLEIEDPSLPAGGTELEDDPSPASSLNFDSLTIHGEKLLF